MNKLSCTKQPRNPFATHARLRKAGAIKPKKGKGSYNRKNFNKYSEA